MFVWGHIECRSPPLKPCRTMFERLRYVLKQNMLENFQALLDEGADINMRDRQYRTPLHWVIYWKKDFEIVKTVLSAGADPNVVDCHGRTPLHAAIYSNCSHTIIKALLKAGADTEITDSFGKSPLMESIYQKNFTTSIRTLLSGGADVKVENLMVESVKAKTDPEVLRLFIEAGASVNDSSTAIPPILHAVLNGNIEVVKILLAAGARTDYLNPESHCTLLHQAHVDGIAQALIEYGMDVNAVDNKGETPIHKAVKKDLFDVVTTLIKAGADVHRLVEKRRENCLHLARSRPMVRLLASHGVAINYRNKKGSTPLMVLLKFCSMLLLLGPGSSEGESNYVKNKKCVAAIKELLKWGADVNAIDEDGTTVLKLAVDIGSTKIMLYLVKYGIRIGWKELVCLSVMYGSSVTRLIRDWTIRNLKNLLVIDYSEEVDYIPRRMYSLCTYAHQCKDEIELMKKKKINCKTTMYHYVVEIAPNIKALRLCSHYQVNDTECKAIFPIYKNKISVRLNKCYRRASMLDVLENLDVSAPIAEGKGAVSLINDCKFAIAEHLSNNELFYFLLALGMKVPNDPLCPKRLKCGEISQSNNV